MFEYSLTLSQLLYEILGMLDGNEYLFAILATLADLLELYGDPWNQILQNQFKYMLEL
jgi:hypothetical protein